MNKNSKMAEEKLLTFSSTLLLISYLFLAPTQAKKSIMRQTDALDTLYKLNYFINDNDDSNLFETDDDDDMNDNRVQMIEQKNSREGDKIDRLPGQPSVGFDQYGGYVTVDEKAGRAFYYYFAEAEKDKNSKPLVLWLNGGPGCSSIGNGAMQELGPFRVHSDGKTLFKNPFAWNNVANVLFLESPVGVGFSYSNTTSDVESGGDKKTARDNYVFLLNWLERFPEYKDRDFYITGENYAGHYAPQLAHKIISGNKKANKTFISLKGIMIGNAAINLATDREGIFDYLCSHALIDDEKLSQIKKLCNFSAPSTECKIVSMNAYNTVAFSGINIYNIYYRQCSTDYLTNRLKEASVSDFDPCSDYYVHSYLNNPQVQNTLHANVTKLRYEWQGCRDDITQNWKDSTKSTIPLLEEFVKIGLRVWVYSGDIDGSVPVTSTRYSLAKMNLSVETPYRPWYLGLEVGGYTKVYREGLTFATVRGAGHEVPTYQPERALSLISHFLDGARLPSGKT